MQHILEQYPYLWTNLTTLVLVHLSAHLFVPSTQAWAGAWALLGRVGLLRGVCPSMAAIHDLPVQAGVYAG